MGKNIGTALVLGLILLVVAQWRHENGLPTVTTMIKQDLAANGTNHADPTITPTLHHGGLIGLDTDPAPLVQVPAAIAAKSKASKPHKARKAAPSSKSKPGVALTDNAASWGGK